MMRILDRESFHDEDSRYREVFMMRILDVEKFSSLL
jgi:hypothetical protein